MTKRFFLLRLSFWLWVLKIAALGFVSGMLLLQVPELAYDLSARTPVSITSPDQLNRQKFNSSTFVSIAGKPDFSNGFKYVRYGLPYTYFNLKDYGLKLVIRTHRKVGDDWKDLNRFLGKLRPFEKQPFSYRIRAIYQERFKLQIPKDAFFLALDDVPKPSGWQIAAVSLAGLIWLALAFFFFLRPLVFKRKK